MSKQKKSLPTWLNIDLGVFAFTIAFLTWMHNYAFEDRFVLILYYLVAIGASFMLVKRRAIGFATAVVTIVAATMFAQLYYSAEPTSWHPVFDAIRDMIGLGTLMYVTMRVMIASYRLQREEKRREVQSQLEQKLVAMRAEALRRTSHEVRTPLSTITAISESLLDGSLGNLSDEQQEFVTDIDDAAQHLLALINDILDYAKAEAGMIKIAPQPVALPELVKQSVTMLAPKAKAAGLTITAQVEPQLNEIIADPLRIRQILLNLLSNAVKYTPNGGSVIVRVRPDGKKNFRISVRDTGRGIAPNHLKHLFEPYYQAAIADQGIGTGLGLAIIKHLVQLHGGTIEVESVVDTGTVFTITLPLEAAATEHEDTTTTNITGTDVSTKELVTI